MSGLIVHEWIERRGGAENVLDSMKDTFPDAPIVCLWSDAPDRFPRNDVHETWLARTPLRNHKAAAIPLMPSTWRRLKTAERTPDWLLVSSHLFAHHVRLTDAPDVPKFVYAHTPARYIWTPELDERGNNVAAKTAGIFLKAIDRRRALEAKAIAANSDFVRQRIENAWRVDAEVIFPPVNVRSIADVPDWSERLTESEKEQVSGLPDTFILGASRFVPYKKLLSVVGIAERLGLPVVLAGSGAEEQALRARAERTRVPVHFVLSPSDSLLYTLYQKARLFVFPPIEDFGIVAVEAMAAGTPVLSNEMGGAGESVRTANGGLTTDFHRIEEATEAARELIDRPRVAPRVSLDKFSVETFRERIGSFVLSRVS